MIALCREAGLPEPDFRQDGGMFVQTIWRDWLTETIIEEMGLNERQRRGLAYLKENQQITNADYQRVVGCPPRTATRDLGILVEKGVVEPRGKGRGAVYQFLRKQAIDPPNTPGTSSNTG